MTEKPAASNNKWFVYIRRCADDSLDTGITTDLIRRCEQHNAGTASRYTRSRLPVVLAYHEIQGSCSEALKREFEGLSGFLCQLAILAVCQRSLGMRSS